MNFYPRPLRGGRQDHPGLFSRGVDISIHALCEEGDRDAMTIANGMRNFYPRPLRGGRRDANEFIAAVSIFLSTPSARRATTCRLQWRCGVGISIHALCEEGDGRIVTIRNIVAKFLSTPSARRATCPPGFLCGGSQDFYPRPLRGGRLYRHRPVRP